MNISEKLASIHSLNQLTTTVSTLSTIDKYHKEIENLRKAIQLKSEGLIYLFSWIDEMSLDWYGWDYEWHAIYQKIWDDLVYLMDYGHNVLKDDKIILNYLISNNIKTIYTWEIWKEFWGIPSNYIVWELTEEEKEKDEDWNIIEPDTHLITREKLNGWMIKFLRDSNIEVNEIELLEDKK